MSPAVGASPAQWQSMAYSIPRNHVHVGACNIDFTCNVDPGQTYDEDSSRKRFEARLEKSMSASVAFTHTNGMILMISKVHTLQ